MNKILMQNTRCIFFSIIVIPEESRRESFGNLSNTMS